ncbi:MAG: hypothetical protein IPH88_18645 [Bacteroidales bacterium]|nr:hypothetical protein [Bacteroidales bacterium]
MKTTLTLFLFSFLLAFVSCKNTVKTEADPMVSHIDSTVKPGDDFFAFANGSWFKQHPIPASEQSNGLWQMIQDTINAQIKEICESAAALKNPDPGSDKQNIGHFFYSGMDSLNLNVRGMKDIQPELAEIEAISDMSPNLWPAPQQNSGPIPVLLCLGFTSDRMTISSKMLSA